MKEAVTIIRRTVHRQSLEGVYRLSRFWEYVWSVVILTGIGAVAARGQLDMRFIIVLAANVLSIAFAFMINDVEDAADDAQDEKKRIRNPVSSGALSHKRAFYSSMLVGCVSLGLYALGGVLSFVLGAVMLLLSFFYSWKKVRLKAYPVLDLISHALMLAGIPYGVGYAVFSQTISPSLLWPFITFMCFSVYGELYNEVRDFEVDTKAGVTHTVHVIGVRSGQWLMTIFAAGGLVAGLISICILQIIPFWVIGLTLVLFVPLVLLRVITEGVGKSHMEHHLRVQEPIQIALAIALTLELLLPKLMPLLAQ